MLYRMHSGIVAGKCSATRYIGNIIGQSRNFRTAGQIGTHKTKAVILRCWTERNGREIARVKSHTRYRRALFERMLLSSHRFVIIDNMLVTRPNHANKRCDTVGYALFSASRLSYVRAIEPT